MVTIEAVPIAVVRPKSRMTRSRPCFDDGALTRVFKFPSRTYPKSSYYLTSSEVIIRIKKARKKWKLVVPKKRVVSYRTNRWFAKPRWIELELTFTQASRLGLVEPRATPPEAARDANSEPTTEDDSATTNESDVDASTLEPSTVENCSEHEIAMQAESNSDDTSDFELVLDQTEELGQAPSAAELDVDLPALVAPRAPIEDLNPPSIAPIAAPDKPHTTEKKARTGWLVVVSALVLVSGIGSWFSLGSSYFTEEAGVSPCSRTRTAMPCAEIAQATQTTEDQNAQIPAPSSRSATVTASNAEIVTQVTAVDVSAEQRTSIKAAESGDRLPASQQIRTGSIESAFPTTISTGSNRASAAGVVTSGSNTLQNAQDGCPNLGTEAQSITILFDYASPDLDRTTVAALTSFAGKLKSCPSTTVVIEGHTDSDGHEDRNETLSWRRAEAVRERLISAGAVPEQLSSIGYGQSRPYLPNVSAENKRKNRRVTLAVGHRG